MLLPLLTTTAAFPSSTASSPNLVAAPAEMDGAHLAAARRGVALRAAVVLATAVVRDPVPLLLCGLSGFAIVFFARACSAAARHASVALGAAGRDTPHTTVFSDASVVFAIAALGGAAFVFAFSRTCAPGCEL